MALPLDQVKVIDADTHMTERARPLDEARAGGSSGIVSRTSTQVDGAATWVVEDGAVLGRAGAGGVVDKHGKKGRSFEGLYEWEIEQAHAAAYDPIARMELLDEIGIWAQIIFPGVVGLGGQTLGDLVQDVELRNLCLEIFNDANAELQAESGNRLLPMAILPAWDIDACVREVQRAQEPRSARRQPHLRSARPRLARPREPRVGPAVGSVRVARDAGALPHRGEPHDDELLRRLPVGLARRRHQARDRRRAAVHRERARRRQHDLLRDARPLSRAQDRVGRERHRLDPVHPRSARLRDGRERAAGEGRDVAAPVGVLQAATSTPPRGSSTATSRR